MDTNHAAEFAAYAVALYAAHHVGDYWVQTDHQAKHKGAAGLEGINACFRHVSTYIATQAVFICTVALVLGLHVSAGGYLGGLAVSAVTHYLADRREYGVMFRLARRLPGKADFLKLGVPRAYEIYVRPTGEPDAMGPVKLDNPSLGTGAWALDQSWHIFWGVFVAALVMTL